MFIPCGGCGARQAVPTQAERDRTRECGPTTHGDLPQARAANAGRPESLWLWLGTTTMGLFLSSFLLVQLWPHAHGADRLPVSNFGLHIMSSGFLLFLSRRKFVSAVHLSSSQPKQKKKKKYRKKKEEEKKKRETMACWWEEGCPSARIHAYVPDVMSLAGPILI